MEESSLLALNFFPLNDSEFKFHLYRKKVSENIKIEDEDIYQYSLPDSRSPENDSYSKYLISLTEREGFNEFECESFDNLYLTNRYLFKKLCGLTSQKFDQTAYYVEDGFNSRVYYRIKEHPQGWETVWLEPYILKAEGQFGFLVDYHFELKDGQDFNREVQKLSLSLDENYQENKNFYVSKSEKLKLFLSSVYNKIKSLDDKKGIKIGSNFTKIDSDLLDTKEYIFRNQEKSKSQFKGINKNGPLEPIQNDIKLVFIYRPGDKPFSYDLYNALKGETFATFNGMEKVFDFKLNPDHVDGIEIEEFTKENVKEKIEELSNYESKILPIIISPWNKNNSTDREDKLYNYIKYKLLKKRLPSQFVSLEILKDKNKLKWAISNIALQIFSKLGGTPWKVNPQNKDCLIIGLGQAHKFTDDGDIEKFFAYSVMTDSSGVYQDIKVLGHSQDQDKYLTELKNNILDIIEDYNTRFNKIAIHTPYNIRRYELETIESALPIDQEELEEKSLSNVVVLKFNRFNKYFCYAPNHNSLTPYESTYVSLANNEFLVWFEGLQYHTKNIHKRISGPIHIKFIYPEHELQHNEKIDYLQDALNLSGANWRGFNAKSLPTSIFYAKLIADYFKEFNKQGLNNVNIEELSPWFL